MSILKTNNADFKITLNWIKDHGWYTIKEIVYEGNGETRLKMKNKAEYLNESRLYILLSHEKEIKRIIWRKFDSSGSGFYTVRYQNNKLLNYLFPNKHTKNNNIN